MSIDCCTNGANNPSCVIRSCGTLIDFKPSLQPQYNPAHNGFEAGKYIDGSIIYAGAGDFSVCFFQNPAPARIMTTNNIAGPGAYSSCSDGQFDGEILDTIRPQYFDKHPDLKWVPTTIEMYSTVPG